jgi:hypothetical protein
MLELPIVERVEDREFSQPKVYYEIDASALVDSSKKERMRLVADSLDKLIQRMGRDYRDPI